MVNFNLEKMPRQVLENAVRLRDPLRTIYLTLYTHGPATSSEIAELMVHARAYVNMRLNQLVDMGLAERSPEGRKVKFKVVL